MDSILHLAQTLLTFVGVLSVIVFVHEGGHFLAARLCGVRVTTFSIGFGRELFGRTDKHGTRWRFSALPLGGYVKMFGDASAASTPDGAALEQMSDAEKSVSFHFKPLWKKAIIVAAGPVANFVLSIAIFTFMLFQYGMMSTAPVVGEVLEGSAAQQAQLQVGDRIESIDGQAVDAFNDIPYMIATNLGTPVQLVVKRAEATLTITLTPQLEEVEDQFGNKAKAARIGIKSQKMDVHELGIFGALKVATEKTYQLCAMSLKALGQMLVGKRGTEDLQGPVGIAKISGQAAQEGLVTIFWLMALISANLGMVNLLPIPLLDGGHLLYYAIEGVRGRPMAEKVQEWGFRFGMAVLSMLMVFTLFNDLRKLLA